MRQSQWPHPGVRRQNRWIDLALMTLVGAILIALAVNLASPAIAPSWAAYALL